MNKRHKYYDVILAFAEGKDVQFNVGDGIWRDWTENACPSFCEHTEWRTKPEPDVVKEWRTNKYGKLFVSGNPNLRLTFDGETGKLIKAEVI